MTPLTPIGRDTSRHPVRVMLDPIIRRRDRARAIGEAIGAVVIIAGAMLACAVFGGA